MIRTALEFIRGELQSYIQDRELGSADYTSDVVTVSTLALPSGDINIDTKIHVNIMLVGIEESRREGKRPYYLPTDDKQFLRMNPPVELELLLLFAAQYDSKADYGTNLRDLSHIISFFQSNSVFDEQKFPSLNASVTDLNKPWQLIERLSFKLQSMSFEQMNNLYGMLGIKYIPSVVYKMNMLTIFDTKAREKAMGISELNFKEN